MVTHSDQDDDAPINGYWIMDPVTWLYVAGTTPVFAFLVLTVALIAACWMWSGEREDTSAARGIRGCANCCTCCTAVLYLTWAVIGFTIYFQEMTDDCIDDEMGDMMYGWSVVYMGMCSVMVAGQCIGYCAYAYYKGRVGVPDV